ncbi:hypothetical protein GCM10008018_58550 [Paenibacillus marchantiophytorum]|uniref:ESAT-6-like protein n=1 Tax=Paenibacillus marchantiophytorum TaxID=1619310 RepID=A0ABQ1FB92_9BACL|nr:WXG100 family type VII secretion target [Paenibacillus marchantiophytorum]GGA04945.1 hypothetical protein GCM10008018_58550 [Paenibacillus marchantiophytorum]
MTEYLKVDYHLLEGKSKEMAGHKDSFDRMIVQANTTIDGLSNAWDSTAQKQFADKFKELKQTFDNFSKMLEDYSLFLKASAGHYRTADEAIQSAIKKF